MRIPAALAVAAAALAASAIRGVRAEKLLPDELAHKEDGGYVTASVGSALRVAWNLATIVTADHGVSSEDAGFYVDLNHIF